MGLTEIVSLEADFYVSQPEISLLSEDPLRSKSDAPPRRAKKALERFIEVFKCRIGSKSSIHHSNAFKFEKVVVGLEYHTVDDRHFFIVSSASKPIMKCDVTDVRETVDLPLQILAHKVLEQDVKLKSLALKPRNNGQNSRVRKRRKVARSAVTSSASLVGKIQSKYRELDCSPALLTVWDDCAQWHLEFSISLRYVADSPNNFSAETNRFLDTIFSSFERSHFIKHELAHYYVQRQFNHQTAKYTKELALDSSGTLSDISQLNVRLLPFQKESVQWMLGKEGYGYSKREDLVSTPGTKDLCELLNAHVSFGYETMHLPNDLIMFWNKFTGYILTFQEARSIIESSDFMKTPRAKGVLSEEMGLGKTLEILALILINKRRVQEDSTITTRASKVIRMARSSLIVCPESILMQWIDEIDTHVMNGSPSNAQELGDTQSTALREGLAVFHYKGFQEVKSHFKTDDIDVIVKQLTKYDIIICSYATVSAEVHYAEFSAAVRYRRGNAPKYDYSSPLSLLQFYRIILDEVQMLRGESTNAARCTGLLHRVHTWGVSGTPINSISDFKTVLSYLQFHPFQDSPKIVDAVRKNLSRRSKAQGQEDCSNQLNPQDLLVKGIRFDANDLMDIFPRFNLGIRHSKIDVADQIRIPQQHNYIVPLAFLPIEQDNYLNLWNGFLDASGYQSDGRGRTYLTPKDLNYWLSVLRKTCCHALMPNAMFRQEGDQDLGTIQSMDAILKNMIEEVHERADNLQRENFTLRIQHAQVCMELNDEPLKAVDLLMLVRDELIHELSTEFGLDISIDKMDKMNDFMASDAENELQRVKAKPHMDLLHQCFFFIATAYYFLGSKKLEAIDDENEKLKNSEPPADSIQNKGHERSPLVYTDVFSEDEMKIITSFQKLEQDNYEYAEILRKAILADRIQKVDREIENVKTFLQSKKASSAIHLREILFENEKDYSSNMNVALCYKKLRSAFHGLNGQAIQFNRLVNDLQEISYKPLIIEYDEENQDQKARDYENTIENQDKAFAILDCLERLLTNREEAALSDEDLKSSPNLLRNTGTFSNYHIGLISELSLYEGPTLKMIFTELKNVTIVNGFTENTPKIKDSFDAYLLGFESEIPRTKKEIKCLRENLKRLNEIYNTKTNYFSNLQRISDSLLSLIQLDPSTRGLILKNTTDNIQLNVNLHKINNLKSRLKYLETLTNQREGLNLSKKFNCTICLSEIFVGSMIKCGHFFCKSCIHSWLKNKSACPLCKMETSSSEVYTFKFQDTQAEEKDDCRDDSNGPNKVKDSSAASEVISPHGELEMEYSQKYHSYPNLEKIHQLTLKESYGCKIDFAVKLVLYLQICHREEVVRDPDARPPQIIIYSQYSDFLDILSTVLAQHAIKHLNTSGSTKFSKSIEKFKKNADNTCLLLDVKKQATGLTLVNATHVFLMEPIINDSAEIQAINRTHRIGQTRETFVWNFLVRSTVEENIVKYKAILEKKKAMVKKQRQRQACQEHVKVEDIPDDLSSSEDEDEEEHSINVEGDESVSGKHIWNCLFHS
ncbi:LAME_0E09626g1_1 [Lachancea meyersii CBS 8951]|uniref:LAME_0E09626g1_1 n=1 Tax=Lachancea meyersii CBS 8951 TaxID=1266667 RepID=A0A1G4JK97_9SACH|nr:LAME_0E09626g1_1 [Lachancea meyersii CBS 8951]